MTIALWWNMSTEKNLPDVFGGAGIDGQVTLFEDYPCRYYPPILQYIGIFQLAYFSHEAFHQVYFYWDRPDTPEYVAHHMATLSLFYVGYLINYYGMGNNITFFTCFSDVFVSLFRVIYFIPIAAAQVTIYFCMLGSFLYLRLYWMVYI
jgi:hypothetical protein